MNKITPEQFEEWLNHPVCKAYAEATECGYKKAKLEFIEIISKTSGKEIFDEKSCQSLMKNILFFMTHLTQAYMQNTKQQNSALEFINYNLKDKND